MGKKGKTTTKKTRTEPEMDPAPMPEADLPAMGSGGDGDGGRGGEDGGEALARLEAELADCEREFAGLAGIAEEHEKLEKTYRAAIEKRRRVTQELDTAVESARAVARRYNQNVASPARQRREDLERRIGELQGIIERQRAALA